MSNAGQGRIENLGQDSSGMTVLYVRGMTAAIADTQFTVRIPDGPYAFYSLEVVKNLKGKVVLFNYTSLTDRRVPRGITFKAVLD